MEIERRTRTRRPRAAPAASPPPDGVPAPVVRTIDGAESLGLALDALMARDPERIGAMLAVGGHPPLRRREPGLEGLVQIIVSQQVSVASAAAIFGRLRERLGPLSAAVLGAASDDLLRECGLSGAKVRTLRALSEAVLSGSLDLDGMAALSCADAHAALVRVRGIGPWTANVFLLFCLGHPDAWPAGDLALQEAARIALELPLRPDAAAMDAIAEGWRPYRAVAARVLWAYYRAVKNGRSGIALAEPGSQPQAAGRS